MKDYAQYTSRIPSPSNKRFGQPVDYSSPNRSTQVTTTRNVSTHPLQSQKLQYLKKGTGAANKSPNRQSSTPQDKRERETGATPPATGQQQRQPPSQESSPTQGAVPATVITPTPATPQTLNRTSAPSPPPPNLNASDALALRQVGPEVTVSRLRQALEEANARDASAKAALAKSDAVILELRGSLRQLKKQMEQLQMEAKQQHKQEKTQSLDKVHQLQHQISDLQHQLLQQQQSSSRDAAVGELQVQLDRAHAQILTADMVRKELEDTLEAEQYTWELRVQDQDRQIAQLQQDCDQLQADLKEARSQWKQAEEGWSSQVEDLQQQLTQARTRLAATQAVTAANSSNEALQTKIRQLEKERAELQNCLDEALQELEAVDKELQEGGGTGKGASSGTINHQELMESMQHLLRWILQEGPGDKQVHNLSRDPKQLLKDIQAALEEWLRAFPDQSATKDGASPDLQAQVQQYQQELKSREESSAELRESLKEAVALLKPLQDAVAKAEDEKAALQQQLQAMQRAAQQEHRKVVQQASEMEALKSEVVHLQQQVEEQKNIAAARGNLLASTGASPVTPRNSSVDSKGRNTDDSLAKIQRAREELRRKRETEGNLQQLLKDAQSRFHSLHQQNEDVAARNRELQGKLQKAETDMSSPTPTPEDKLALLQRQLRDREAQVVQLQQALERNGQDKVQQLDKQLEQAKKDLATKEQSEKILNKSLKDALGLLKPLQLHLEEAEREKMDISRELRNLRKRFRQLQMGDVHSHGDDQSKSTFGGDVSVELIKIKEELEETVRQLEMENSQLHDALEDMSENGMAEAKLRQKLVELNSRYEVTQNKLEDAHVENHALVKALKQKEAEERRQAAEMERLRRLLSHSEAELTNAKSIAKTALVKVEELTMNSIEQMSRDGSADMHHHGNIPLRTSPAHF